MKYIIRKIVEAKNIKDCINKEKNIKPVEIYLQEDEFKRLSVTTIPEKILGFENKKINVR